MAGGAASAGGGTGVSDPREEVFGRTGGKLVFIQPVTVVTAVIVQGTLAINKVATPVASAAAVGVGVGVGVLAAVVATGAEVVAGGCLGRAARLGGLWLLQWWQDVYALT